MSRKAIAWLVAAFVSMQLIAVDATVGAEAASGSQADCLVLAHPSNAGVDKSNSMKPILIRELYRQALLITARDELGLSTRDGVLRELADTPGTHKVLVLDAGISKKGGVQVDIFRGEDDADPLSIWSRNIQYNHDPLMDYPKLIEVAERLSRTKFQDILSKEGFPGKPPVKPTAAHVPAEIEKNLWSLNPFVLFGAIRQLHDISNKQGESPEIVGGLVRGYANLGILTERHWNVSRKVFAARSLIYAQRMVTASEDSAFARAHLAYAMTLAGLHTFAMKELKKCGMTESRPSGATTLPAGALPDWIEILNAACHYDNKTLKRLADAKTPSASLAFILLALQADGQHFSPVESETARALIESCPDCLRVIGTMSEYGPIDEQHAMTELGLSALDWLIRDKVSKLPGLPAEAQKQCGELQSPDKTPKGKDWRKQRAELVRSLVSFSDPQRDRGEPSWAVLGHLIEEELFVQTLDRAWFLRQTLGMESDGYVNAVLPLIPDHPYRNFMRYCGLSPNEEGDAGTKLLSKIVIADADVQMNRMFKPYRKMQEISGRKHLKVVQWLPGADDTARDRRLTALTDTGKAGIQAAHKLLVVSQFDPMGPANLIRVDWEYAQPRLSDWDKEFCRHPRFLKEAADRCLKENQLDKAEKYYNKVVEADPEPYVYWQLANVYSVRKDDTRYIQTLKDGLQAPESGLQKPRVRMRIAKFYMSKNDYEAALPYAKEAAESYAGDTLKCLAECYEGVGDFEEAEKLVKGASERYRSRGEDWFFWCKRTGYGDVKAAAELAGECLVAQERKKTNKSGAYAVFLVLTNEHRQAMTDLQNNFDKSGHPWTGLHCALLADKLGERKLRDEVIAKLIEKNSHGKSEDPRIGCLVDCARLFQSGLQADGHFDVPKIQSVIDRAPEGRDLDIAYFAGRFLEAHNDAERARPFLLQAAQNLSRHNAVLARDRCRQLGLKVTTQPASQPGSEE